MAIKVKTESTNAPVRGQAAALPRTHGGNIREAAERYGFREREILDFSSSINPMGPPAAAVRAARRALADVHRYPDPAMKEAREAIAAHHGIDPASVICGNGSTSLIHLIPRVLRPRRVLIPVPTFTEYAHAAEAADAEVVPFPLDERKGFRIDAEDLVFALSDVDMAFLCNPNSPTGTTMHRDDLAEIIAHAHRAGVCLVVDETFIEFTTAESVVREAAHSALLICLRAFTKFYGMPGLRAGYAVADRDTVRSLRAQQEPWSLSIPAGRAAVTALGELRFARRSRALVARERERLLEGLRLLPGVEPFPGAANYLLLRITSMNASDLAHALALRGILVRDCASIPGLDDRYLRVAVRKQRENARLITAMREILLRPRI